MWKEYSDLRDAEASYRKLQAWARKYGVKLKGKNEIRFVTHYKASTAALDKKCSDRCGVKVYQKTVWLRKRKGLQNCTLSGCIYHEVYKKWYCTYACAMVVRAR